MLKIAGRKIVEEGHKEAYALLEELYGAPLPEIAREPGGKPYFPGNPVHFSITHTKKHVFCVLSDCPIGIDAEELDRKVNLSLAEKILTPDEYAQYLEAEDKKRALLTFWVLKEAAAKCTGQSIFACLNKTKFSLQDKRVQEKEGCLVAVITEDI